MDVDRWTCFLLENEKRFRLSRRCRCCYVCWWPEEDKHIFQPKYYTLFFFFFSLPSMSFTYVLCIYFLSTVSSRNHHHHYLAECFSHSFLVKFVLQFVCCHIFNKTSLLHFLWRKAKETVVFSVCCDNDVLSWCVECFEYSRHHFCGSLYSRLFCTTLLPTNTFDWSLCIYARALKLFLSVKFIAFLPLPRPHSHRFIYNTVIRITNVKCTKTEKIS